MLVSKAKPVYAVTHDEDITIYADKVCKLNGDALIDLSREEMLQEIYQDEDKYGLSDIYCAYHGYEYLDSLDDIRGADRLQVGTGNPGCFLLNSNTIAMKHKDGYKQCVV